MANLYIDCTQTYYAETLSGIQRVVRSVVEQTRSLQQECSLTIKAVVFDGVGFNVIDKIPPHKYQHAFNSDQPDEIQSEHSFKKSLSTYLGKLATYFGSTTLFFHIKEVIKSRFPSFFYLLKKLYLKIKFSNVLEQSTNQHVVFSPGDVLFMLDAAWFPELRKGYNQAKNEGALVIFAAHDIIPVSHPQFCNEYFTLDFSQYLLESAKVADAYLAVSKASRDAIFNYLKLIIPERIDRIYFDYFYLGADVKLSNGSGQVRDKLVEVFNSNADCYLMVSTIEPRKNHLYLIDAFEMLWGKGVPVNLVIVGRVDWNVDELMQRLNQHVELNKHLYVFHDLNDSELSYAYKHSKSLVFPSVVEGFGLPIIEALQHRLPVILSDIPIHREIGGDLAMYVDLRDPMHLARLVEQIHKHGIDSAHQVPENYRWLTWQESTKILLDKIQWIANQHLAQK